MPPSKLCRVASSVAIVGFLMLAVAAPAWADSNEESSDEDSEEGQALGLYVSNIAGSGLTYLHVYPSGWGYHLSGIGWGTGGSTFLNVGGAVTKELDRRDWGTLYGLVAAGTGLGNFFGGGGLPATSSLQYNVAPGVGVSVGPLLVEVGYSVFYNGAQAGFGPAGGAGLAWWF